MAAALRCSCPCLARWMSVSGWRAQCSLHSRPMVPSSTWSCRHCCASSSSIRTWSTRQPGSLRSRQARSSCWGPGQTSRRVSMGSAVSAWRQTCAHPACRCHILRALIASGDSRARGAQGMARHGGRCSGQPLLPSGPAVPHRPLVDAPAPA